MPPLLPLIECDPQKAKVKWNRRENVGKGSDRSIPIGHAASIRANHLKPEETFARGVAPFSQVVNEIAEGQKEGDQIEERIEGRKGCGISVRSQSHE